MTPGLDKISQNENKHNRAGPCLKTWGQGRRLRGILSETMTVGVGSPGTLASLIRNSPRLAWPKLPISHWPCLLMGELHSDRRSQIQYKPLSVELFSVFFNRLEIFYIHWKTTFEWEVWFSKLCFVFALIKFPLTQISLKCIKCGSHQKKT